MLRPDNRGGWAVAVPLAALPGWNVAGASPRATDVHPIHESSQTYAYPDGLASRTTLRTTPAGETTEHDAYHDADGGWRAGLPFAERTRDAQGALLAARAWEYEPYPWATDPAAVRALVVRVDLTLEGTTVAKAKTAYTYACTGLGCTTGYEDYGNPTRIEEWEFAEVVAGPPFRRLDLTYWQGPPGRNVVGLVETREVVGASGIVVANESFVKDAGSRAGYVLQRQTVLTTRGLGTGPGVARTAYDYTGEGNPLRLATSRGPRSGESARNLEHDAGRLARVYRQDDPTREVLARTIDLATGLVEEERDANGHAWCTGYAGAGRRPEPRAGARLGRSIRRARSMA